MMRDVEERPKRAVVAAVQLQDVSDAEFEASVTELRQLAKTLGFEVVGTFVQKRRRFDATGYLGLGKRQELRRFVRDEREPDPVDDAPSLIADDDTEGEGEGGATGTGDARAGRGAARGGRTAKRAAAEA